jgi:hypothetical protein
VEVALRPWPVSTKGLHVADDVVPIAYSALAKGVPVLAQSGQQFGTVEHVLQIPQEDLFDGIVVATSDGLRFVDRDQIGEIATAYVRCTLTDQQAAALPEPSGDETYQADVLQDTGASLHDRFGRMFGRARWTQKD